MFILFQLKRQHSADLLNAMSPATRRSPASNTPTGGLTPPHHLNTTASPAIQFPPGSSGSIFDLETPRAFDETNIGSPLKKQRASVTGLDDEAMKRRLGLGLSGVTGTDILAQIEIDFDNKNPVRPGQPGPAVQQVTEEPRPSQHLVDDPTQTQLTKMQEEGEGEEERDGKEGGVRLGVGVTMGEAGVGPTRGEAVSSTMSFGNDDQLMTTSSPSTSLKNNNNNNKMSVDEEL